MSEFNEVLSRLNSVENRQTRLETKVDGELASRDWVREIVDPIKETTRKIEQAVESMGRDNQALTAAHNKLLEERSQREKVEYEARMRALEAQTWSNIIKEKWQPVAAFIVAASAILTLLGHWLSTFVNAVPKQ